MTTIQIAAAVYLGVFLMSALGFYQLVKEYERGDRKIPFFTLVFIFITAVITTIIYGFVWRHGIIPQHDPKPLILMTCCILGGWCVGYCIRRDSRGTAFAYYPIAGICVPAWAITGLTILTTLVAIGVIVWNSKLLGAGLLVLAFLLLGYRLLAQKEFKFNVTTITMKLSGKQ